MKTDEEKIGFVEILWFEKLQILSTEDPDLDFQLLNLVFFRRFIGISIESKKRTIEHHLTIKNLHYIFRSFHPANKQAKLPNNPKPGL